MERVDTNRSWPPYPPDRVELKKSDSPSNERLTAASAAELFMVEPRLTGVPQGSETVVRVVIHMSTNPNPPDRLELKKSDRPSAEMKGVCSQAELLIVGPRFTGSPQGSCAVSRVVTHISKLPDPPGLSEVK